MTTPDPQTVREIARTAVRLIAEDVARERLVHTAMAEHGISTANVYAWSETYDSVLDELATVLKPLTQPDEQQQGVVRQLRAAFAAGWHAHDDHTAVALAMIRRDDRENAAKAWVREFMADAEVAEAAQDGLSATETTEDGVQGSGDVSTPVRATEGLSEPRPTTKRQPLQGSGYTPLQLLGVVQDDAERDDTTEDGQHG